MLFIRRRASPPRWASPPCQDAFGAPWWKQSLFHHNRSPFKRGFSLLGIFSLRSLPTLQKNLFMVSISWGSEIVSSPSLSDRISVVLDFSLTGMRKIDIMDHLQPSGFDKQFLVILHPSHANLSDKLAENAKFPIAQS